MAKIKRKPVRKARIGPQRKLFSSGIVGKGNAHKGFVDHMKSYRKESTRFKKRSSRRKSTRR